MGKAKKTIVAVVAVVATVVAGPQVGAAILETTGMAEAATAAGISADMVGAAAISGASNSVNAAIDGKDLGGILKAGVTGAAKGGVGQYVGQEIGTATSSALGDTLGQSGAKIAGSGLGSAASGVTQAALSGANLSQALKAGEIAGLTGAITQALYPSTPDTGTKIERGLTSQSISQLLGQALNPPKTYAAGAASAPITASTVGQPSAGTQALAGALNVGGGDISPPVTVSGEEKKGRNVWNVASLRTKDETGA